jgi:hypothetical protein
VWSLLQAIRCSLCTLHGLLEEKDVDNVLLTPHYSGCLWCALRLTFICINESKSRSQLKQLKQTNNRHVGCCTTSIWRRCPEVAWATQARLIATCNNRGKNKNRLCSGPEPLSVLCGLLLGVGEAFKWCVEAQSGMDIPYSCEKGGPWLPYNSCNWCHTVSAACKLQHHNFCLQETIRWCSLQELLPTWFSRAPRSASTSSKVVSSCDMLPG